MGFSAISEALENLACLWDSTQALYVVILAEPVSCWIMSGLCEVFYLNLLKIAVFTKL